MTPKAFRKLLKDRPDIEVADAEYLDALQEEDRPHKFNAQRTEVDGRWFASKAEAGRYQELCLLEQGGLIRNLECQPRYRIEVNGIHICDYVADFRYLEGGKTVVEDVKGVKTPAYVLKRRLMQAVWEIEVVEV